MKKRKKPFAWSAAQAFTLSLLDWLAGLGSWWSRTNIICGWPLSSYRCDDPCGCRVLLPSEKVRQHQQTLLDRIPSLPDVQSAWALLLHCAAAKANYFIRVVPPDPQSRWPVVTRCGNVSVPCFGPWRTCARVALGRLPRCHSPSVVLG